MASITGQVTALATGGAGLGVGAARGAMIVVWSLNLVHGLLSSSLTLHPNTWIPYLAGLAGALLLTRPGAAILPVPHALGVVFFAVITATAVFGFDKPSQDIWIFSYASYLVALMIARGNPAIGGVGGLLVVGIGIWWLQRIQATPEGFAAVLGVPVIAMIVGYLWRGVFHWIVAQERKYRKTEERAILSEQLALESATRTRNDLREIHDSVAPILSAVLASSSIDQALQMQLSLLEMKIRDQIRAPELRHPQLESMISSIRQKGAQVLLLGVVADEHVDRHLAEGRDEVSAITTINEALAAAVSDVISEAQSGDVVTIRSLPDHHDAAISVTIRTGEISSLHVRYLSDGRIVSAS